MFSNLKEGTQLMSIYQSYFYIIQEISTGLYYAGSKYGKDANPETFMIEGGYTTSSETINELISQYGLNNFIIRKIRTFETAEEAYDYETKFLQKVDARKNPKFYNAHNNDHIFSYHDKRYKEKMIEVYGVDDPNKSPEIVNRIKETNMRKLGVPWPMMSNKCKEKRKQTNKERYGVENVMFSSEIKEKMKQNNLQKYDVENVFQLECTKEKIKISLNEKYGVEHPMHSNEVKQKQKETNNERYGVDNVFQTEETKSKIKERTDYLLNRPQLDIIRKYKKCLN
jgi:hypothetical protein